MWTGFLFGLVETTVVASQPILFRLAQPVTAATAGLISTTTAGLSIIIDPILVFAAMFVLGSGIDIPQEYLTIFAGLLLGVLAGTAVSFGAITLILIFIAPGFVDTGPFVTNGAFFYGVGSLRLSLVGFAGLAMAYFSRSRGMAATPP